MSDYIKREDAIKAMARGLGIPYTDFIDVAERCMDDIPTANVVEVVRCKDCIHRYVPTRCALWQGTIDDKDYFIERGEDFYCSYGERKTDD